MTTGHEPLRVLIEQWRELAAESTGPSRRIAFQQAAGELEAALAALPSPQHEANIYESIGRYVVRNARWLRHEHEHYAAAPVAFGASLESEGHRFVALRDASEAASGDSQGPPLPQFTRDRDATCEWNCQRPFPHDGPCAAEAPPLLRPKCQDFSPAGYTGHWRDWHRGHGCDLDPTPAPLLRREEGE